MSIISEVLAHRVATRYLESRNSEAAMMVTVPAVQIQEVSEEDEDEQGALSQPLSLQPDYGKSVYDRRGKLLSED